MSTSGKHKTNTAARRSAIIVLGMALSSIVGGAVRVPAAEPVSAEATKEAEGIYKSRCTLCHGGAGKGDGPAGAALNPKPRDMSDPSWQKSVTDEHIEKIILAGGTAVGKTPLMPGNPDLKNKPDVIRALRQMVRDFDAPK